MLKLKLKNVKSLASTLTQIEEEGETLLHTDGVLFKAEILEELRGMESIEVVELLSEHDVYDIGVKRANGVTTFISPLWVKKLYDGNLTTTHSITNKLSTPKTTLVRSGDIFLQLETNTLIHTDDVKICTCCSAPIEDDNTLHKVKLCNSCFIEEHFNIRNYSYKPDPKFTGTQIKADIENPIWYGIELEYGVNSKLSLAKVIYDKPIYLKSDTSIDSGDEGRAEMVTHPHSFTSLMSKDSWVNKLGDIDCNESIANGCHIHVSRTAWHSDTHYALMYYLMYELGEKGTDDVSALELIGGREFTSYCTRDMPSEKIHRLTKDGAKNGSRSVWCNENNSATVEFRFFSGTNSPEKLKRYIQFIDACIKYTRYHSKTVTVNGLLGYIKKHNKKYGAINEFINNNLEAFTNKSVVFRLPTLKEFSMEKVPFMLLSDTTTITTKDGVVYQKVSSCYVENQTIYFLYDGKRENASIKAHRIKSITVEV